MQLQITSIIRVFFAPLKVIVGTPKFIFKTNKVVVQVPYFMPKGSLVENQINALGTAIADSASTSEIVELRLIRLQYPYLDSSILAQYLALNARKYNFLRMKKRLFKKTPISSSYSAVSPKDTENNGIFSAATLAKEKQLPLPT